MIIYKDIITNDEMFSDIYSLKTAHEEVLFEVEGKLISRKEGQIDDSLIGGNASAEDQGDTYDENTVSGVDIVMNHNLQEIYFEKKEFKKYIQAYLKDIKTKLEESNPDRVKPFMEGSKTAVVEILKNFNNYKFYQGESLTEGGAVGFLDYREDGITPFMLFFKDGLEIEKC
ncbi:translationally-controlled tumor protein homolog [Thalassophryne amazonica]|uniref:translationally-controlled tumor protein homolog n=1 Tax=Thalassophryne amazonica TaxID=390379 RepID=UPI00147173CD|nr:translationally-controlled tumor protein homolog [Thalassophryne amazonica]